MPDAPAVDLAGPPRPRSRDTNRDLKAMRRIQPELWESTIRRAMKHADGKPDIAASALGISRRQLFRLLQDPRLSDIPRAPPGRAPGTKQPPADPAARQAICRQAARVRWNSGAPE